MILKMILAPNTSGESIEAQLSILKRLEVIKRSFTNQMIIGFDQTDNTLAVSRSYEHLFKHM